MRYSALYTKKEITQIVSRKATQHGDLCKVKYSDGSIGSEYATEIIDQKGNPIEDHFYQVLPSYPTNYQH